MDGKDFIFDFDPDEGDRIELIGFSSERPTLSGLIDADNDGARDDQEITLPDGGEIALLNVGNVALSLDDLGI